MRGKDELKGTGEQFYPLAAHFEYRGENYLVVVATPLGELGLNV